MWHTFNFCDFCVKFIINTLPFTMHRNVVRCSFFWILTPSLSPAFQGTGDHCVSTTCMGAHLWTQQGKTVKLTSSWVYTKSTNHIPYSSESFKDDSFPSCLCFCSQSVTFHWKADVFSHDSNDTFSSGLLIKLFLILYETNRCSRQEVPLISHSSVCLCERLTQFLEEVSSRQRQARDRDPPWTHRFQHFFI